MKRSNRLLLVFLLTLLVGALLCAGFTAAAEEPAIIDSGFCGAEGNEENVTWTLTDDGTLTVSGTGEMMYRNYEYYPWFGRSQYIKTVVIEDGVTNVSDYAFGYRYYDGPMHMYKNLTRVVISGSVTTIGSNAFANNTALTDLTIADGVENIGSGAFYGCTSLTEITIPASVKSMGLFGCCDSLTAFRVDPENSCYASDRFGCLYNKDMTLLIQLPAASEVTEMNIPAGVTDIGPYAFSRCENLRKAYLPNSTTTIGDSAFSHCNHLTYIYISSGVRSIDFLAFFDCSSLTEIYVDSQNPNYSSDFNGCLYNKEKTCLIRYPAGNTQPAYVIPEGAGIAYYAMEGCSHLKRLTIPGTWTMIDEGIFYGCTGLTDITIPASVTEIEVSAFLDCSGPLNVYYGGTEEQWEQVDIWCYLGDEPQHTDYIAQVTELLSSNIRYNTVAAGWCGAEGDGTNLSWTLDVDGTLTVSGEGDMKSYQYIDPERTWLSTPVPVRKVVLEEGVTSIGGVAFYGFDAMTDIEIPAGVTSIGETAFCDCVSQTSVAVPEGVTRIGHTAFYGCSSLTDVTLPDCVTSIGPSAFEATAIYADGTRWENNVLYIGNHAIKAKPALADACLIRPGTVCIADEAFLNCDRVKSIVIPDSTVYIGWQAFERCTSLTSLKLGNSVSIIRYQAFSGCSSLTNVTLPESVTVLDIGAFGCCTSLTDVVMGDRITLIGDGAFSGVPALTNVFFAGSREQWEQISISRGNGSLLNAHIHYNAVTHTPGEAVRENETPAACTANGGYDTVVYCAQCPYEFSREHVTVTAGGHVPGAAVKENIAAATCTSNGGYDEVIYCINCPAELSRTHMETPATGHAWGEWEVVKQASVNEEGLMRRICANDPSHVEEEIIPKLQPQTSAFQRFIERIREFFQNIIDWFSKLFRF